MDFLIKNQLSQALSGGGVLVIEPSSNYRTSIKQFLLNLAVKKVKLVNTVAEARRELITFKAALFIVEWSLDHTNGIEFCRALRKEAKHRDIPFLLLSTENMRGDVILATEVSISGYLLKPFSYEDFSAKITQIMLRPQQQSPLSILLNQADALLATGDLKGAEAAYLSCLTLKNNSARALCGIAKVLRAHGKLEDAITQLRAATLANPDYIEAYRTILDLYEQMGNREAVVETANVLHRLSPENPRYTLTLARSYLEMKKYKEAEQLFRRTVLLSPKLARAYKGLGEVYLAQEDYEKAMKNFKKALDLEEGDVSVLNSLGMIHVRCGQIKEGIDRYTVALKLDPKEYRVLFNLGQAYEKSGQPARAKSFYGQALKYKPGYERAIRGLARIERALGHGGEAATSQPVGDDEDSLGD